VNWSGSSLLTALQFLTPGFVAAWIRRSLTTHRKPTDFQRLIQALDLQCACWDRRWCGPVGHYVAWAVLGLWGVGRTSWVCMALSPIGLAFQFLWQPGSFRRLAIKGWVSCSWLAKGMAFDGGGYQAGEFGLARCGWRWAEGGRDSRKLFVKGACHLHLHLRRRVQSVKWQLAYNPFRLSPSPARGRVTDPL